jgi:putative alpha-1,2-mannosidase
MKAICSFFWMQMIVAQLMFSHYCYSQDYTHFVNPFIGTAGTGHTYPGATSPFGMVQLNPNNNNYGWQYCSG